LWETRRKRTGSPEEGRGGGSGSRGGIEGARARSERDKNRRAARASDIAQRRPPLNSACYSPLSAETAAGENKPGLDKPRRVQRGFPIFREEDRSRIDREQRSARRPLHVDAMTLAMEKRRGAADKGIIYVGGE